MVPLGTNQSRGDQIENAKFFEKNGFALVIQEDDFKDLELTKVDDFYNSLNDYKNAMIRYKSEKKVINNVEDFYNKILKEVGGK